MQAIPFRKQISDRIEKLWNYAKYSSPMQKGGFYYYFKNDGMQNQSVLYRQVGLNGSSEEVLNPNTMSKEGIAALGGMSFSKDGKYMAFSVAMSGSDWHEISVMDMETKTILKQKINWVKFSGMNWKGNDGFYYSCYDKPDASSLLTSKNEFQKVYYHKLGTDQSQDKLVFEDKLHPQRYFFTGMTEDERFLMLNIAEGTSGGEIQYRDLNDASGKFKTLVAGFTTEPEVIDNDGDKLLIKTNDGAPNYKIVLIDPKKPGKENWTTVVAEKPEVLQSVGTAGGFLFLTYLKDASSVVQQYSYQGKLVREIKLPGIGTASGFAGEKENEQLFYSFTSFVAP
ncbi:MAG: S9 family peptidase, partial [Pedobacter sp.]